MPSCFIHGEYSEEVDIKYLQRQKKIVKQYKSQEERQGYSNTDPRGFLILDDCLYDS